MSRITAFKDNRFTIVTGNDHMLGVFIQLYDKEMESETPDGEGIMLDWSQGFKFDRNLTGISNEFANGDALLICQEYISRELNMNEDECTEDTNSL